MAMTTRDRALAALRLYPDSHSVKIAAILNMTTKRLSSTITTLLADGLISRAGIYGKRTYRLTDYGMRYAPASLPDAVMFNSRLVVRTEANGICQEDGNNTLAALKMTLAGMEAEPVAYMHHSGQVVTRKECCDDKTFTICCKVETPLYAAPQPATVVSDENYQHLSELYHSQEKRLFKLAQRIKGPSFDKYAYSPSQAIDVLEAAIFGVDEEACRAAMLQAGNSPVIQDGWVACSERMPDIGTEIFYFCQGDGLRDCGIVSSSNFSGKGDAELYVHAESYDLRFGVDINHWMPLPAAPQQEADNG